jgi:DNA polymerase I-like protein with 3'-5' exonuclease and polymerase domains
LVVDAMGHAADLVVPLDVNLAFGPTWADAKG